MTPEWKWRKACNEDKTAFGASMAAYDEVLEDEPTARSIQLVGTDRLESRFDWNVAV